MADYESTAYINRDQIVEMLSNNAEQLMYVLTTVIEDSDIDQAIDEGQMGNVTDPAAVATGLRRIASAIDRGELA